MKTQRELLGIIYQILESRAQDKEAQLLYVMLCDRLDAIKHISEWPSEEESSKEGKRRSHDSCSSGFTDELNYLTGWQNAYDWLRERMLGEK